jgi:hypothetical protein
MYAMRKFYNLTTEAPGVSQRSTETIYCNNKEFMYSQFVS